MVNGALTIIVSGSVLSTIQVKLAGVGSTLPAASIVCTRKVCAPSLKLLSTRGVVQALKLLLSNWQAKPASPKPPSSPLKLKLAETTLVLIDGLDVIVVSG